MTASKLETMSARGRAASGERCPECERPMITEDKALGVEFFVCVPCDRCWTRYYGMRAWFKRTPLPRI